VERLRLEHVATLHHDDVAHGEPLGGGRAERHPVGGQDAVRLGDADVAPRDVDLLDAVVLERLGRDVERLLLVDVLGVVAAQQPLGTGGMRERQREEAGS
jgi:hypothetical protein